MRPHAAALALCALLSTGCSASRSAVGAPAATDDLIGATELASTVIHRFTHGAPAAFDSVYPFERGRGMVAFAASRELPRIGALARPIAIDGDRALVALGGHVPFGNSGDETGYAEAFSNVYEARRDSAGRWSLTGIVPLDSLTRIRAHSMHVWIDPGAGLRVRDSIDADVRTAAGFAVRLNHTARIRGVAIDGTPALDHYEAAGWAFGGGLLWITAPQGRRAIVLEYTIDVARDSATESNSARFAADHGHVRNQYFWHPRGAGWADFELFVHAPAHVHVATDLPQRDSVAGERFVRARSRAPADALSLVYDAAWTPTTRTVGDVTLALFTTPDFTPSADSLVVEFERVYSILSERFAPPASRYFAVAQQRARSGRGWLWRSNELIGAGANGGPLTWAGPPPRASFGHEVAHGWLTATGPASNFIGEGWAMLVESMLIADAMGAEAERVFWGHRRNLYFLQGFEGSQSLLEDPSNGGIAYTKGAWVLRMLRDYVGAEAFADGMRAFMRIAPGEPAGLDELARAMSDASGRDVAAFLAPWVQGTSLPRVDARVVDGAVILEQNGPAFVLPLEVDLLTSAGPLRRTVLLDQRVDSLPTVGLAPVRDVVVDPEQRILMHRDRGERVRFELRAPGADSVQLVGDFRREPIEATRQGDVWVVEVPLTAGTHLFDWRVDGTDRDGGVRRVEPREVLAESLPR